MSEPAIPFDPEAIARRVAARQARAPTTVAPPVGPFSRNQGSTVTGSGSASGIALPPRRPHTAHDLHAAIEAGRSRRAVRSPLPPAAARPESTAVVLERAVDAQRFAAPSLVDEPPALEEDPCPDPDPAATAIAAAPASTSSKTSAGAGSWSPTTAVATAERADPDVAAAVAGPSCAGGPCGDLLTGGGAPRGWVLVRVIGAGAPRRYCGPGCATTALQQSTPAGEQPPAPVARPRTPRGPDLRPRKTHARLDLPEIIRRYQAGQTPPLIAAALGTTGKTIRRALDHAGIERRDDRATASGSQPKAYDPALVERIRALYTDQGLSQSEVADQIGTSTKVVTTVMTRYGIPAREPGLQHKPGQDRAAGLKARMATAGISAAQVRAWARTTGIPVPPVGLLKTAVVEAYLVAHPKGDPS